MKKINWRTIRSDISEARSQLQNIEKKVADGNFPDEDDLRIYLLHAYHHLNFAWNARYVPTEKYANLTDNDFEEWGKYPTDIEDEELY